MAGNNNQISNLQVTIRVKSDGFVAGNIANLISGITFDATSREDTPTENPDFDYTEHQFPTEFPEIIEASFLKRSFVSAVWLETELA